MAAERVERYLSDKSSSTPTRGNCRGQAEGRAEAASGPLI